MAVNFGVAVVHGSILPFLFACFWGGFPSCQKSQFGSFQDDEIASSHPIVFWIHFRPQNLQRHPNRSLSLVFVLYIVHMVLKSRSYLSVKCW